MVELKGIKTEERNPRTMNIDALSTAEMVALINSEDKKVALAVEEVLPEIAKAVDMIYERLDNGGRLIYCGCGTSGRLGVLDAAECPPTFGVSSDMVMAVMAGGAAASANANEGAEDNFEQGGLDLKSIGFSKNDVLVGIAASGRTPYVLGAMSYAKNLGADVIALTCNKNSPVDLAADIGIAPMPGAEVITGSTRLKSGTAQKMVLNMLSTAVMIKLGKVYQNLMVDVKATNEKLAARSVSIVSQAAEVDLPTAEDMLRRCDFSAKTAITALLCNISPQAAAERLKTAKGKISETLKLN